EVGLARMFPDWHEWSTRDHCVRENLDAVAGAMLAGPGFDSGIDLADARHPALLSIRGRVVEIEATDDLAQTLPLNLVAGADEHPAIVGLEQVPRSDCWMAVADPGFRRPLQTEDTVHERKQRRERAVVERHVDRLSDPADSPDPQRCNAR